MAIARVPETMTPKALKDIAKILDGLVGFIGRMDRSQFANAEGGPIPDDMLEGFFQWLEDPEMQDDLRQWAAEIQAEEVRPECEFHLNACDKDSYCISCGYQ